MSEHKISINALNKTGSMFLYFFYKEVCRIKNYKYYSPNNQPSNSKKFNIDEYPKKCICPVRNFPEKLNDSLSYIFLLRNPLDILISEYYSFGWMHHLPPEGYKILNQKKRNHIRKLTIDEYCIEYADNLYDRYKGILNHKNSDQVIITLYSEMVTNFKVWLDKAIIPFNLDDDQVKNLYDKFNGEFNQINELKPNDIINNNKKRHKRKMIPGDHKEKLKEETIELLKEKFSDILNLISELQE